MENQLKKLKAALRLKRFFNQIAVSLKTKNGIIRSLSNDIRQDVYDIANIKNLGLYQVAVEEFKKIFDEQLSSYNNTAFYKNMETLRIREERIDYHGRYLSEINKIELKRMPYSSELLFSKHTLFHELIHMATSYDNGARIGFRQQKLGRGLNEGYTELINKRYFSKEDDDEAKSDKPIGYGYEQELAYGIELLVGQNKMESLFFNADLYGLIEEMSKYTSREESTAVIKAITQVTNAKTPDEMKQIATLVKTQISNIINRKNRQQYLHGQITRSQFEEERLRTVFYMNDCTLKRVEDSYEVGLICFANKTNLSAAGINMIDKFNGRQGIYERDLEPDDSDFERFLKTIGVIKSIDNAKWNLKDVEINEFNHLSYISGENELKEMRKAELKEMFSEQVSPSTSAKK